MDFGNNIRLTRQEVEQAVRERVLAVARSRGQFSHQDPVDFHNHATVTFLDANNVEVPLAAVEVTIER